MNAGCSTPSVPRTPSTDQITCNTFRANWTAPSSGTPAGYYLDLSNDNFTTFLINAGVVAGTATNITVTGLTPGTTYQWRIRAYNTQGANICSSPNTATQTVATTNPSPANAGPDQTLAVCATTTSMNATAPAGGYTGTWSVVTGTATITTPTSRTSGITGLIINTSTTLRWTVTNGTCTTTDDVVITTTPGPGCITYCVPSYNSTYYIPQHYIRRVSFVGTLQDVDNPSSYDNTAPYGYQNFTGLATKSIQAQGEGVNIYMESTFSGYYKAWVDWNKDGDFLDAGETVYNAGGISQSSTTFGFVIPPATPPGNYRVRLRMSGRNGAGADGGFAWDACTTNVSYSGEAEDYEFTVIASCNAIITDVTDGVTCGPGTVNLSAVGTGSPSQYRWYTTETGGAPVATTATGNWTTPSLATTTTYWVTAFNGCESHVRTKVIAYVNPLATITFTPSVPEVCGENNVLSLTATGDVQETYLVDEHFNSGLGVMTNQNIVSNGAATNAITQWQTQTSTFVPSQQTWYPAIASGLSGNNFAMATSDVGAVTTHNAILSPIVNTNTYLDLTLSFDIFHSRYYVDGTNTGLEYVTVDVSTNGGGAWTELERITTDLGYGTRFVNKTYNLNAYINQPNFRVRVRYYAEWCDGLAIDNFQLYGNVPLNTAFDWTAASPVDAFQDAACTIPYVSGTPIVTVYVRPNLSQLESPTYDFTATAILSNGCSVSQDVSINNKTSIWKGTNSNDWNDPTNWEPNGVPDPNTCVVIPDVTSTNYSNIGGASYDAFGRTLQVLDNGELQLRSGNTLTIGDYVEVEPTGLFHIENSASLIQINNVANTGNITMDRNAVTNSTLDYVYWSTPVAGFSVNNITPSSTLRYSWVPTINNGGTYAGNFGNWSYASGAMSTGSGYIIRGSSGISTFTGVPNNGNILTPITRSTYTGGNYTGPTSTPVTADDDNWNLLGNPYPSSLSADDFLTANSANIEQFVKIWTHGIDPAAIADPFYQDYVLNYNVADYITYNALGGTQSGFDGYIGAGQGFFVLMNDANTTSENAIFNNAMRSNSYRNDQFFRNSSVGTTEKHRIWLKMIAPSGNSSDMLVGYTTNASNGLDAIYDTKHIGVKTNYELYSIAENQGLIIQGKSLPFDNNDTIPLGYTVPSNGIYTITIDNVDGLFKNNNQNIYLEDKLLGIIHDLRIAPYSFTANTGRVDNRFELRYTNNALSQESFDNSNAVYVYTNENNINIKSNQEKIKNVTVFDLLGREIYSNSNIEDNSLIISNLIKSQSAILVKVELVNGNIKTTKILF